MFLKVAGFEFRYQLRQPAFWVIAILFALLGFGMVAVPNVDVSAGGNVYKNAPYALSILQLVMATFFMLGSTVIVANVIVRDVQSGFGPIIQSTRLTRFSYLYGRFAGAFAASALCFLSVSVGILAGTLAPWIDQETMGPFRPGDYLYAYAVMGLPAIFLTSALFFALATVTRSMMATYVGVVGVFIAYMVASGVLGSKPELEQIMAWAEPFGSSAFSLVTKYWTPAERNTLNVPLTGVFLGNRLLWTGVGLAVLAATYWLYRPIARGAKAGTTDKLRALAAAPAQTAPTQPLAAPSYGLKAGWTQLWARTRFEMALVFKSPAYVVLMLLGLAFALTILSIPGEIYGTPVYLVTRVVITALQGSFGLVSIIVAIYYSGELIWRDRDRKVHELIDSTSTPDWTFLLPKTLALVLVLASILVVGMIAGIGMQIFRGVHDFEIGKYLVWYVLPNTVSFGMIAVLAIVVQSLSPNKFVGWAVMVVYLISTIVFANMGFDHVLYRYGADISVPLSDMNGRGQFWKYALWTQAYWTAGATLLLVLAYGLWRRGTEIRYLPRLRRLPQRLKGSAGLVGGLALAAFAGLGVFIFINTNVWNEYRTKTQTEQLQADYEKTLLRYEKTPQPSITDVKLDLDLYPHQGRLQTRGTYVIENRTGAPLQEMHLRWNDDLEMKALTVQGARMVREWPQFDYRIYRFDTPMAPGEKRTVAFDTLLAQRGFKNSGNTTRLVDNGTFLSNMEFAPIIGMDRSAGLLTDRAKRRKYGLPEGGARAAKLEDLTATRRNYIGADWVNTDITVTTETDQTPLAPGYQRSDVVKDGRRTVRFVSEAPVLYFLSMQSARYVATHKMHKGVDMVVYHDAAHGRNVPRMMTALAESLDYFQAHFSPYQFRQARISEFPAYADYAQSMPNTFAWSEGFGFIADFSDTSKIDYVTYVAAHEFAHQWWAHQIVGADMQGMTLTSETLAQYSALMVMEKMYGPDKIRRFLKYELDAYLRGRATERTEEQPLNRVENQQYIHYRKGAVVMYLLRDQIGEAAVNRALSQLLQQYAFKGAPYARSTDLITLLRANAPADKQALITDLFEKITLYDVRTTGTSAVRRPDGKWDVSVTVEAKKLYVTGKGKETEAPLNETFDVGLFSAKPGDGAFDRSNVLVFERRPLRTGTQTFRFVTATKPTFAGVDPYNKWIDRNSDDNLKPVT